MAAPIITCFHRNVIRQIRTANCNYPRILVKHSDISGFHTAVANYRKSKMRIGPRLEAFLSKKQLLNPLTTDQLHMVRPPTLTPSNRGRQIPSHASIRLKAYNTIVEAQIHDVLNSNAISEELQLLQAEVVAVRYSGDMSMCRVFWRATGKAEEDHKIQSVLNKYAPKIRHYLISHHILGKIPQLCFFTNKAAANAAEIERLLTIADFGPEDDIEGDRLSVSSDGKNDIEKENMDQIEVFEDDDEISDSEMDSNSHESLFGIDHSFLHTQIHAHKKQLGIDKQSELCQSSCIDDNVNDLAANFEQFRKDLKRQKSKRSVSGLRKEGSYYRGELDETDMVEEIGKDKLDWDDDMNIIKSSVSLPDDNSADYENDGFDDESEVGKDESVPDEKETNN